MVQSVEGDSQDNHWLEFITRYKFLSSAIGLIQFSTSSHLDSSLVSSTLFHPLHSGPRLFTDFTPFLLAFCPSLIQVITVTQN